MGGQSLPEELHPAREEQSPKVKPITSNPPNVSLSASPLTGCQLGMVDRQQRADATQDNESAPRRPRRFLAQPIETSSRSSQTPPTTSPDSTAKPGDGLNRPANKQAEDSRPRRRFLPEPIETTKASNRGASSTARAAERNVQVGPRRFKPDLIETDHRSVKGKTVDLPLRHDARPTATDGSGLRPEGSHVASRLNPNRTPFSEPAESRFSYASLIRRQETRRHSFRVPELPSIPSNSSEESDGSFKSPSLSPSPKSTQPLSGNQKSANIARESCDGEISEYLLSLAARSAQKQLKDQALAAFPNEQVYEPVDHFAIDEDEMGSEEEDSTYPQAQHIKSRRQSSADLSWELEYMRQHKEEAEMRLRAMVASRNQDMTSTGQKPAQKSNRANPPMLGDDIVLPQSLSPDGTMCENVNVEKDAQAAPDPCSDCGGLWCATSRPEGGRSAGLWMGTCRKGEGHERESHVLTGIMTPMPQDEDAERDPFSKIFTNQGGLADQTGSQNAAVVVSKTLEDEFHDGFVTQIYNYLSLGYPSVARYYDYELSRISGITVEELRRDDQHTDAKGYVVAPENNLAVACMRWKALRLYIREWARQQPTMAEDETGLEAWGMPERRGSWAF